MLAVAKTFAIVGVEARPVEVEVDVSRGLPAFAIVGLPDPAVREARERVRGALLNAGFEFPLRRITANLAPADLRKVGPGFDLAIAAALLVASGQLPSELIGRYAFAGELALDGAVRGVNGVLAMSQAATEEDLPGFVVAAENSAEAGLVERLEVVPLERIGQLEALASGDWEPATPAPPVEIETGEALPDVADLRGQPFLRFALEVAAAGGHSMLMIGPAGAGKSLAARRLPSLMPALDRDEALEVTRIASACGRLAPGRLAARPYRDPHHTISAAGLVGGGSPPRAGEVTLAHRGVLFLDELGEFSRAALEALRQPLEQGSVTIVRAGHSVSLPCRFMLVAAANPCPCGRGPESDRCRCGQAEVARYAAKLSGPLADRIDICVAVSQPSAEAMRAPAGEASAAVRERVQAARARQGDRLGPGRCNADMSPVETRRHCSLDDEAAGVLARQHAELGLSGRGHERVLRVARTLADLEGREAITAADILTAGNMRKREDA
jgi:magnesium chelatase family protein